MTILGCSSYQPTKNVWKTTKGLWHSYVSPPASVDYESRGGLSPQAEALSRSMLGIDKQLTQLERTMQNADKPPTQEWLNRFFASFPWVNGFAGVKYDGTLLGQEPPNPMKELDFNRLLYEDKKQNSRALRADVMPGPLGPEIMLATPLYDGVDFLGIVVAYFDMRSLMQYAQEPQNIVILCPTALLWPGKYEFAATPLAGTDWNKVVLESTAGTCTNSNGTFFYMVRFLGNLPLVFAIPEKGNFPEGDGNLEQGQAFFPAEREKVPPPPLPERKPADEKAYSSFGASEEEPEEEQAVEQPPQEVPAPQPAARPRRQEGEIEPGSRESLLLRKNRAAQRRQLLERQLEGENIEIERVREERAPKPTLKLLPDDESPTLPGGRPSPFGPRTGAQPAENPAPADAAQPDGSAQPAETPAPQAEPAEPLADGEKPASTEAAETPKSDVQTPATREPAAEETQKPAEEPGNDAPRLLPGGRPSPFGPRN